MGRTLTFPLPSPLTRPQNLHPVKLRKFRSWPSVSAAVLWFLLGAALSFGFCQLAVRDSLSELRREVKIKRSMEQLRPTFVLFGDSITQHSFQEGGWGAALQNEYARKVDVVLRGYSGYNTKWALFLLSKVFPKSAPPPALVTVFFGANDAALEERQSGKQHVAVGEYQSNLEAIIEHIQGVSSSTKVVLITPPPVHEESRLKYAKAMYGERAVTIPERTNEVTRKYAEACKQVGARRRVPVLDIWSSIMKQPQWDTFLSDGLHLSPSGNGVVFSELMALLKSSSDWQPISLVQQQMPWDFPEHTAIDGQHPEVAFGIHGDHERQLRLP